MLMTASFITYQPEQQQLLPCALQDWLPQGLLAYFISDTVDSLNLNAFHARYAGVVRLAREMGLVKLGTIAVDGTKLKANASRHKAMSYVRMQTAEVELKAQIAALVKRAATADEAEKSEPDLDIPAEIQRRQARLAAIAAAKARLEERQRQSDVQRGRIPDDERKPRDKDGKPKGGKPYQRAFGVPAPKAQDSLTDPESRIMKRAGGGFDLQFNAQTAVDEAAHIIVAAEVANTSSDVQQLPMVLAAVKAHTGAQAAKVLADAGYRNESVMAELAINQSASELVIALGREGKVMVKPRDDKRYPHTVAMAAKLETEQTKIDYRKRKWIAEPPNGWINNVLGFRQFSMRGLKKAQAEFKLVCMALNLRRMGAMRAC